MFLTKSQVEELNYQQCVDHLRALTTRYNIDAPLQDNFSEIWPILDQICDTLLELQDRIARYEHPCITSMDKSAK
jgi:hypothetical protein